MGNIPGKPFTDTLGEIANGEALNELTAATYEIIEAVMDTRKPGSISFTINFNPTGKGSIEATAKIANKVPEHDKPTTTFFVGKDFSLQRSDPNQPRLPLREVEVPNNEPIRLAD